MAQRLFFAACRVAGMALDYLNFSCILLVEWWWVWGMGQAGGSGSVRMQQHFGINSFKW